MALPPGPAAPAAVQMLRWMRDSYGFLDACSARFGDRFTLNLAGFGHAVFTGRPADIHAVFTADPRVLLAGKGNDVLAPFLGPHSLLTLDGPRHQRDRKLMTPPFHGARMRAYGGIVRAATRRAIAGWRAGETVQAHPDMQRLSMEVILRAVFGVGEEGLEEAEAAIGGMLRRASPALLFVAPLRTDLGRYSPWGRWLRMHAETMALLRAEIAARRDLPGEDILSLLLQTRDEQGQPLSDAELEGELVTLLVAGHETTATALAWSLAWLASSPEDLARVVEEIGTEDDPDALAKLPFLGAVCSEALRVYPVFPLVMRVAAAPFEMGDVVIPEGARVAASIYLAHRRPDTFEDPEAFRPARFLDRTYPADAYFPFGGGVRRCIGAAFAMYEMKIALATILQRFGLDEARRPVPERIHLAIAPRGRARIRLRAHA